MLELFYRTASSLKLRFGSLGGSRWALSLSLVGAVGCGGSAESFELESSSDPELGSVGIEARVEIERSRSLNHEEEEGARGEALAQFSLIPASWYESERQGALARAGLRRAMPAVGDCELRGELLEGEIRIGVEPLELEPIELLAAGDVRIEAGGHVTRLSLHGFPLSGAASGVLYTTRDRAAEPLPNAALYAIEVEGSAEVPQLSLLANAPAALESVSVAGEPLAHLDTVVGGEALSLSWEQGAPEDVLYVELAGTEVRATCAFADELGAGTVPADVMAAWAEGGELRLSLHRVRQELSAPRPSAEFAAALAAVVRFDFAIHRTIEAQAGN